MKNAKTPVGKLKKKMDVMFSKIVRSPGRCARCGATKNLQCAHVISRKYIKTRWDTDNAIPLCTACHLYWNHKEPHEFVRWFDEKYGENYYDNLKKRANVIGVFDYEAKHEELKRLLEDMK